MNNLETIQNHISKVRVNADKLSFELLNRGEDVFARKLIALSYIHDNSKFFGIEWSYLNEHGKQNHPYLFKAALEQHQKINPHHPEYWDGIENMPRIYLAEFVCDTIARSQEFGTDYRAWILDTFKNKYKIKIQNKTYKETKEFIDLSLEKPFVKA